MSIRTNREKRQLLEDALKISVPPGTEVMHDVPGVHFAHTAASEQAFFPTPSADPADPLNWSKTWKSLTYGIMLLYVFMQCYPTLAVSFFYGPMGAEFNVGPAQLAYFTGGTILALGWANVLFIPIAVSYGRRPALMLANLICVVSYIWQARAASYGSLMGGRILNGVGACLIESIGPMMVDDLFFVHQRGTFFGLYMCVLFAASGFGPFLASVFAQLSTWRNYWWMSFATAVLTQIALFFMPETKYSRTSAPVLEMTGVAKDEDEQPSKLEEDSTPTPVLGQEPHIPDSGILGKGRPNKASFKFITIHSDSPPLSQSAFFSFVLVQFPIVVWAGTVFAFAAVTTLYISITQAILFGSTGYNFTLIQGGSTNFVIMLGVLFGSLGVGWISDKYVGYRTRKNNNIREPEFRLALLVPFGICLVIGIASLGVCATRKAPWPIVLFISYFVGNLGIVGSSTIALTYACDAYAIYSGEVLTLATLIKNTLAFGFSFFAVDWSLDWGWERALGLYSGCVAIVLLLGALFYFFGKKLRVVSARSYLMRNE